MRVSFFVHHTLMGMCLSACSQCVPFREVPEFQFQTPAAWTSAHENGDEVDDLWWLTFQSDDLNHTVDQALDCNYSISEAAARVEIAAAEARISAGALYPYLSGGLDGMRQRINSSGSGGNISSRTRDSYALSLDVSWELDLWGRISSEARAGIADEQASQANYVGVRLSIAGQSAKAWLAVTEAQEQLELTKASVDSYRTTSKVASNRVEAGIQPPNDKHLALTNQLRAEALLQERRESLDRRRRQLEVLLGDYPSGALLGGSTLPEMPPIPALGIPADLIRRRPDLVLAERELAASLSRVDVAQAALYPRISLVASAGTVGDSLKNLLLSESFVWSIAKNILQPIFEGGRLRARVMSESGKSNVALARFAQTVLDALLEVETSLHAESLLEEREKLLFLATIEANQAVEVSQNRYLQGIEQFIVLLESQRQVLEVESALLAVRRLRLDNRVNLHLALGGGFGEFMPTIPSSMGECNRQNEKVDAVDEN